MNPAPTDHDPQHKQDKHDKQGALVTRLISIATDALDELGLLVDDLSITPAGKRRVVRVSVDDNLSAVAPGDHSSVIPAINLDQVAEATKALSTALDDGDAMGSAPYVLEVSSPGVGRPLTEYRQFRRNVGRLLEVVLADGSTVTGRIAAARPDELVLTLPATKAEPEHEQVFPTADLGRARVQVEFNRADTADLADADDSAESNDDPQED